MTTLQRAYNLLFCGPQHYHLWEMAKAIIDNFDVRILGEELSAQVLCFIIAQINFPLIFHQEYILKAERLLPELLGVNPDHEFNMDEAEYIQHLFTEGKNLNYIKQIYQ